MFDRRGDNGTATGALAVDAKQGWKGPGEHVATVPHIFDIRQDPQERYDIFMNDFSERTCMVVAINIAIQDTMKTYVDHPPRTLQSEDHAGPP
ncbi:hypothetical protein [Marilutibacter aestuarii]|uniref:Uncharacterized protein n=1 Tax=Marilutibacter aestuarii TaxID=1706195 RepID=A0A508AUC5_9GAMM|nr:hypothetical protein [Lysobacter aestuarii]TQD51298.1 hypothetical protein FKV25_01510 [Lysobacter aestuarii]